MKRNIIFLSILLDAIANRPILNESEFRAQNSLDLEKPIIALLPGSRKQEVQKMLSVMLSLTSDFSDYEFVIAGAPSLDKDFYASLPAVRPHWKLLCSKYHK